MDFRDAKEVIRLAEEKPNQKKLRVDLLLAVTQLVQDMTILGHLSPAVQAISEDIRGIFFKE